MKKGVRAIIFDVGGVLAIGRYSLFKKRGHRMLGVHEFITKKLKISLDQWFDSIDTSYANSIEGGHSKKQVLKIFSKNLKSSPEKIEKLFIKAYKKNFKQNKQLFKQAFKLQKKGYKIAILSDQWPVSKEALMPEKIYKKFNEVVVSCEAGMRKPNLKIYKMVLKKLKIKPFQAIFIDNQKWNLQPAKKIRMKTILFKNNKQLFKQATWKNLFK
jgi:epoxide hydrolase-like predicted phosphatase